jgi:hypothetical protein
MELKHIMFHTKLVTAVNDNILNGGARFFSQLFSIHVLFQIRFSNATGIATGLFVCPLEDV